MGGAYWRGVGKGGGKLGEGVVLEVLHGGDGGGRENVIRPPVPVRL